MAIAVVLDETFIITDELTRDDLPRPGRAAETLDEETAAAVEAAILMEQPLDKVMTMILFGLVKKGVLTVEKEKPLKVKLRDPLPEDIKLWYYERRFIKAVKPNGSMDQDELQEMVIDLIGDVNKKVTGFSRAETKAYYKDIAARAWQQAPERFNTLALLSPTGFSDRRLPSGGRSLTIVDRVDLEVAPGEFLAVLGPSGSGKSTLVRHINRLIEPTAGNVIVDGKNVTQMKPDELVKFRLHNMSMVFQSFALMPHMTVLENAAFGLELANVDKQKRRERAMQALEQVGLSGWETVYPQELSGGMQQRAMIASATCRAASGPRPSY